VLRRRVRQGAGVLGIAISAAALFLPSPLAAQDAQPLVLILAGQSNMVGQGATVDLGVEQATLPRTVKYFLGMEETAPADRPRFGLELTLGQELARAMPEREIILVKYAVGGTSLLAWAPEWNSTRADITRNADAGPLYRQLRDIIAELRLRSGTEVGAVFWMQGERDAWLPEVAREYFDNLTELVAAFRRDLNAPELPFLFGLVNPPSAIYPAREIVREAQARAAREIPGVYLVATDDLMKWDDDLHYDTSGILELGRRFAATFLAVRKER
jgi:Carbohydrate esterase, sialic acid-specific acetylesterase